MKKWLVFDGGCADCANEPHVLGVYHTEELAVEAIRSELQTDLFCTHRLMHVVDMTQYLEN